MILDAPGSSIGNISSLVVGRKRNRGNESARESARMKAESSRQIRADEGVKGSRKIMKTFVEGKGKGKEVLRKGMVIE